MTTQKNNPRLEAGGAPETQSLARTAATTEQEAALQILRGSGRGAHVLASPARRGRAPLASASLYEPSGRATQWWLSIRCPWCGAVHLGRVRTEAEAGGKRKTGCGRVVWVKVRSVYRSNATKQVAA